MIWYKPNQLDPAPDQGPAKRFHVILGHSTRKFATEDEAQKYAREHRKL